MAAAMRYQYSDVLHSDYSHSVRSEEQSYGSAHLHGTSSCEHARHSARNGTHRPSWQKVYAPLTHLPLKTIIFLSELSLLCGTGKYIHALCQISGIIVSMHQSDQACHVRLAYFFTIHASIISESLNRSGFYCYLIRQSLKAMLLYLVCTLPSSLKPSCGPGNCCCPVSWE